MTTTGASGLSLNEYYQQTTRDLYWEPTYVPPEEIYPPNAHEPIYFKNWDRWQDPFRMFYKEYVRVQSKKEVGWHAMLEAAERFGYIDHVDPRWLEGMKLYMPAVNQAEYEAHRNHLHTARFAPAPALRQAALYQAMDELRHAQNDIYYPRWANRHRDGFGDWAELYQSHWLTQPFRTVFEDLLVSGPFETCMGLNFVVEVGYTNLLFVVVPSVGVANGEYVFGQLQLTTQSDETRHMAIGQATIRTLLEEDSRNIPIVQEWFDKWTWRNHRLFNTAVSIFNDYFARNKTLSFKEAYKKYFLENFVGGMVDELGPLGLKPPRFLDDMIYETEFISHVVWKELYMRKQILFFKVFAPDERDKEWLREKYPDWDRLVGKFWDEVEQGAPGDAANLPMICNLCHVPCIYPEPEHPTIRTSVFDGRTYWFCSDGCKWIFDREPQRYWTDYTLTEGILTGRVPGDPEGLMKYLRLRPGLGGVLELPKNGR